MTKAPSYLTVPLFLLVLALVSAEVGHPARALAEGTAAVTQRTQESILLELKRLKEELRTLQEGLPAKREALVALRHRWMAVKGRTPTAKELEAFAKKQKKGATTVADNPFVNKNPLSTPAPARAAYYAKLKEVRDDEERVQSLEAQLDALVLEAARGGVALDWRK